MDLTHITTNDKFIDLSIDIQNKFKEIVNEIKLNKSPNNITIASGIGDILLTRLTYSDNSKIYYNIHHLLEWKPFPDNIINIIFNYTLLKKLFNNNVIIYYNKDYNIIHYDTKILSNLMNYELSYYFDLKKQYKFDYIIIHTKVRFGNHNNYIKILKDKLVKFFSQYKCSMPILILGERKIAENIESKIIKMETIYDEILLCKKNNTVIDLTHDVLYNTPTIENFEKDLSIIYYSKLNIGVGHGGQFCINLCFSQNTLYYTPPRLINFPINKQNFHIYTDIDLFLKNFPS